MSLAGRIIKEDGWFSVHLEHPDWNTPRHDRADTVFEALAMLVKHLEPKYFTEYVALGDEVDYYEDASRASDPVGMSLWNSQNLMIGGENDESVSSGEENETDPSAE